MVKLNLVICHWSFVIGHWSFVIGHLSFVIIEWLGRGGFSDIRVKTNDSGETRPYRFLISLN